MSALGGWPLTGLVFTTVAAELVNWAFWVATLLPPYLRGEGPANFVPWLLPLAWPVLPILFAPAWALAVFGGCGLLTLAVARRAPALAHPFGRACATRGALFGGALLYLASFPVFFVWNQGAP